MKLLSSDTIRRCLVADPGKLIISADFDQIELRVIAALAQEPSMIEAAKNGESLHVLTATRLFGEDYTPDQYKLAKNTNFTWTFGGGAETMVRRYGLSWDQAKGLISDFEKAFTALTAFKRREQDAILRSALSSEEYKTYKILRSRMFNYRSDTREGRAAAAAIRIEINRLCYRKVGYTTTPFGRRLAVDLDRPYSVVNYKVQSSARDIMAQTLLDIMADYELEPTVLLIIHDEFLGQAPKQRAHYYAERYAEVMKREFMGVPITAEGKVYGKSWGHGYRK